MNGPATHDQTVPLTPLQVIEQSGFADDDPNTQIPIVKIPVAGPAPFNMLATVRSVLYGGAVAPDGQLHPVHVLDYPTALTVERFDPDRPEQHYLLHSTSVGLRLMNLDKQIGLLADNNTTFTVAIDSVDATSRFDEHGNWLLSFSSAISSDMSNGMIGYVATSWVLYYEPPPPDGRPDPPAFGTNLRGWGKYLIESTRTYATRPGAAILQAVADLTKVDGRLSAAGWRADAQSAQQAAVELAAAYTPPPEQRLDYLIALAEAEHNLLVRKIENGQTDVAPLASSAIGHYRDYARIHGADLHRAAKDLGELVKPLLAAHLPDQALAAQQADLDILQNMTVAAAEAAEHQIEVAEAEHNLIARLIDDDQTSRAAGLVDSTLADYRAYLQLPGADRDRVARDLHELSADVLIPAGLTTQAEEVQQLADTLTGPS